MFLSKIFTLKDFKLDSFIALESCILYFKEIGIQNAKKHELDYPLYKVISYSRAGKTIGIIVVPKYKWTVFKNGIIIEHPNFVLSDKISLVTVELIYWTEVQFVTNSEKTATIICKSLSDTPNY
jgi:hypothetical protein